MNRFFIFVAEYLYLLSFLIAGVYMLRQPGAVQIRISTVGLCAAVLSLFMAYVASRLYYDPRPFVEGHFKPLIPHDAENGFPSDHTLLVACIASVLTLFTKRISILLWLIALLVGVARVYVGVHHPLDIAASIFITIMATYCTTLLFKLDYTGQVLSKLYLHYDRFFVKKDR